MPTDRSDELSDEQRARAERILDAMVENSASDQGENPARQKLARQFERKLAQLEADEHAAPDMIARLRLFWRMLDAPDEVVPWSAKAQLMAALAYFASPLDMIPDLVGKLGYVDDALVLRLVESRLRDVIARFQAA
ncbi:YkvA family protein [Haliangium sp.]|uniref:YkvA family protein n=1 Tax=Haliangium sp. TaxID=2663208 RepID=UPI003D1240BC